MFNRCITFFEKNNVFYSFPITSMKLVFVTNLVHHHQTPVADEFYKKLGDDYKYITTEPMPEWLIRGGYDPTINKPYIVRAYESVEMQEYALKLSNEADVVIIGSAPEFYVKNRIKKGKITFRYSERWFKNRKWYMSGPKAWIHYLKCHIIHWNKPLFMLAASAYTCRDVNAIGAYFGKVFKWGYFTRVDEFPLEACKKLDASSEESAPHIMWCARFLRLKHPEMPVKLAKRLKDNGYDFHIDMFGSGEELSSTKQLAKSLDVNDKVSFCGNLPNEEILEQMRQHEIFLFTSDRNEGWGAVLNESMSNGCAVVASNLIGSVPFLIQDGKNGMIFMSEDLDSLEKKVLYLLNNPSKRIEIAKNAIFSMRNIWSPKNAAKNFFELVEAIKTKNRELIPEDGPCSRAERI